MPLKGSSPIFVKNSSPVGMLLLHSFSSTPDEFRGLASFLSAEKFSVYAPLLSGHGTTARDLMATNWRNWLRSARDAYQKLRRWSEKIIILGNSFGGNLALHMANPHPRYFLGIREKPLQGLAGIIPVATPVFFRNHQLMLLQVYTYGLLMKMYQKPPRFYRPGDVEEGIVYDKIPTKNIREITRFIRRHTKRELREIAAPTLIMYTANDPVVHPDSVEYLYRNIGSTEKEIYNITHLPIHAPVLDESYQSAVEKIISFTRNAAL